MLLVVFRTGDGSLGIELISTNVCTTYPEDSVKGDLSSGYLDMPCRQRQVTRTVALETLQVAPGFKSLRGDHGYTKEGKIGSFLVFNSFSKMEPLDLALRANQ